MKIMSGRDKYQWLSFDLTRDYFALGFATFWISVWWQE
jgi:hypothetical protein